MNRIIRIRRRWTLSTAVIAGLLAACINPAARAQASDPCLADLNGDAAINVTDLLGVLAAWGTNPGGPPDFDGDGVGMSDLLTLLGAWGPCDMLVGPISGLSIGWHRAPGQTAIPVGTTVHFKVVVPLNASVIWTGANEIARDWEGSTAACPIGAAGQYTVSVDINSGQDIYQSVLDAVDILVDDIIVSQIVVSPDSIEIDETLPPDELNEVTMAYFFGPSIAPNPDYSIHRPAIPSRSRTSR